MRLIDADSLINAIENSYLTAGEKRLFKIKVNKAPTVEERPQGDERAIEILTNYEKTACNNCRLRPCNIPCDLLIAVRYAITYMKKDGE